LVPGTYQWIANAFNGGNCSGTSAQQTALTVTIGAPPINHTPAAVADLATVVQDNTLVTGGAGCAGQRS
jgi:hypothetical protein